MFKYAPAALIALLPFCAQAQEYTRLGFGYLLTNDFIGDGQDRWRTGSVASSRVWGRGWDGALPSGFGDLIELRLGAEIIAPANLEAPDPADRPYAGALSVGLHSHFQAYGMDMAVGGDLVVVGPSTGLDAFHGAMHDVFGGPDVSDATRAAQIDNGIYPTLVVEAGRRFSYGDRVVRPFVEGRAGAEMLVRAGVDVRWGGLEQGGLLVRDPVSGQHYRAIDGGATGFGFVLGGDVTHVAGSVFLPEDRGYKPRDARVRARAGMEWRGENGGGVFYGLSYLGQEFEGQGEGQFVGSFRAHFRF
ncbi:MULTISPECIES: lipid A-modifier LpxR family protein [Roseobacteraceae]|uniref:Lipid A deacylase LpxR family protein n=1 Tax=Pseudosulfitobacter pseudonitzschiae TaxID=1402135 RepID=A0A221JX76_9RHOB|nr:MULTISPECIES: lipid A-modifier LpxR family protein [Roseobacteraceae]ASM71197.1 hypothetical protein SULPSESMR1_00362 [Pseudosulfitobacter pseudonitzschiae]